MHAIDGNLQGAQRHLGKVHGRTMAEVACLYTTVSPTHHSSDDAA